MTTVTLDCKDKNVFNIIDWCDSHFGMDCWNWASQFPSYRYTFTFETDEQATHFRLRWQ